MVTNQVSADQSAVWEAVQDRGDWEPHLAGPGPRTGLDAFVPRPDRPALEHVHVLHLRDLSRGRTVAADLLAGLGTLVDQVRPDLVHVNAEPWNAVVAQAMRSHPVVVVHGCETSYSWGGVLRRTTRRALTRAILQRAAGFASWNEVGIALARETGFGRTAPTVVAPAITAVGGPRTEPEPVEPGALVVGFVARLLPEKGLSVLLPACDRLAADGVDVRLVVVGDGPTAPLLQGRHRFPVEHLGRLPNAQTLQVMRRCSVLAVPSLSTDHWEEQFGRVVVEAFAASVPVVSSDSGALPEVVADAGVVVPEGDVGALADALLRFRDPGERARTGMAGRQRWERLYAPSAVADQLVGLWDRVLAARTAGAGGRRA